MARAAVLWDQSLMHGQTLDAAAHVVQLALTPIFFLTGLAQLLNVFTARLARISDRVYRIAHELTASRKELTRLRLRSRILDGAVLLAAVSGALTCFAALIMFLGALRNAGAGRCSSAHSAARSHARFSLSAPFAWRPCSPVGPYWRTLTTRQTRSTVRRHERTSWPPSPRRAGHRQAAGRARGGFTRSSSTAIAAARRAPQGAIWRRRNGSGSAALTQTHTRAALATLALAATVAIAPACGRGSGHGPGGRQR